MPQQYATGDTQHVAAVPATATLTRWLPWAAAALIVLVGLAAYWPTLAYNFFWEDPFDIGQVDAFGYLEVLLAPNSNSYYRPLALVVLKALRLGGEVYRPLPFHIFVVAGHLLAGAVLFGLARYLFRHGWFAFASGLLYVIYPLPFEATARASSMHGWLTASMFASFWLYVWGRQAGRRWPLWVALVLMTLAQTLHENGLLFPGLLLMLEVWLVWQQRVPRFSWGSLRYFIPAIIYFFIWLNVPKPTGAVQFALNLPETLYLSQGVSFPFAGPIVWAGGLGLIPNRQAVVALVLAIGLLVLAHGREYAPRLALAGVWWLGAVSLVWLARPIEYLEVSPRVMYFPSFAAALLWAGLVDFGAGWVRDVRVQRVLGGLLLAIVAAQSWYVTARSVALYQTGSDLMGEVINAGVQAGDGGRVLYINVPDRFEYKDQLYPLGYWGMLAAPVSQGLSDFITFSTGVPVETESLSDFLLLDEQVRAAPYWVNTRGSDAARSDAMYDAALWADVIMLAEYGTDGRIELSEAGTVMDVVAPADGLATYAEAVQLVQIDAQVLDNTTVQITLHWYSLTTLGPDDTVFVHLVDGDGILVGQADGHSLRGLLPVSAWRAGNLVRDERVLRTETPLLPGDYAIAVGLYNRITGERLPAFTIDGDPLSDNGWRTIVSVR